MPSTQYLFCLLDDSFNSDLTFPARLDLVLRAVYPALSRRKIATLSNDNKLFINGRPAKPGDMLKGKEEISFEGYIEELLPSTKRLSGSDSLLIPSLDIIYEDEHIMAVNKPRGMHSVLQKHSDPLTLADLLAEHEPKLVHAGRDPKESGLVQRLDYWTSGIIIACKERKAWESLHQMFISKKVEKTYIAEIEKDISALPATYNSFRFEVYKKLPESTLVRITLNDGSRHVVRKTFANIGYPLPGDTEYGSPISKHGFVLHAEKLNFLYFNNKELSLEVAFERKVCASLHIS